MADSIVNFCIKTKILIFFMILNSQKNSTPLYESATVEKNYLVKLDLNFVLTTLVFTLELLELILLHKTIFTYKIV